MKTYSHLLLGTVTSTAMGLPLILCIRRITAAVVSAAAGLLVWTLSSELAGTPLPWDAAWPFYSSVLFGTGLVVAQLTHRPGFCVLAAWAGQIAALILLPLDRTTNMWGEAAWWVLGILATGIGSLLVAGGWIAGRAIRNSLSP
ncbi:MAG: hypothetical protein KGZ80_06395 [Methylomonas sp.]|nr:hypothetical protein [Methylomonas sp.]